MYVNNAKVLGVRIFVCTWPDLLFISVYGKSLVILPYKSYAADQQIVVRVKSC